MKRFKILIILLPVFLLASLGGLLIDILGGRGYQENLGHRSDADILNTRLKAFKGDVPKDRDVYFLGTSRTIALYDPYFFNNWTKSNCSKEMSAFNLGNLANDINVFLDIYGNDVPGKVLILEYHPLMFVLKNEKLPSKFSKYQNYQKSQIVWEEYAKKYVKSIFGQSKRLNLNPTYILNVKNAKPKNLKELGQVLQLLDGHGNYVIGDGHVRYRHYIASAEESREAIRFLGDDPENYEMQTKGEVIKNKIDAYFEVIKKYQEKGNKVIVVRPPVRENIYLLEKRLEDVTKNITSKLEALNIKYYDFNPNSFIQTDGSHIDSFNVEKTLTNILNTIKPCI